MKLKLKHIAPYLPYGLKVYNIVMGVDFELTIQEEYEHNTIDLENILGVTEYKPILRPLSDLFNGNYESILDEFSISSLGMFETAFLSEIRSLNAFDFVNYTTVLLLLENHFDIYGLIENGLAIDINTLQK